MKLLLVIVIVYLFYRIVIKPLTKIYDRGLEYDLHKGIDKALNESLERTKKENELLKRLPTEEEIKLYYKMYLKKLELSDTWNTYQVPFEEFEERAKNPNVVYNSIELGNGDKIDFGKSGGFSYLFEMTSDLFMGGKCIRLMDYEKLVEEDEKKS